ncbi:MAG: rane protein YqaE-like protein [Mucilaginibacter sp.]|nr:rane protein YqaE-like protein [Mucilaginibacter sp.]
MRYFICFLCPPLAILTTGKVGAFILNIFLTLFFWIPGIIHAILVTNKFYDDRRHRQFMAMARRR